MRFILKKVLLVNILVNKALKLCLFLVTIKYCWQNIIFFFHLYRHVGHIGWDPQGGFDVSIPRIF